jgi:hypothetical protein
MGDDDRREIFERLEALERMLRSRHEHRRGGGDRDRDRDRDRGGRRHHDRQHDDDFDEKRIIDTIVRLVSEQMTRLLDDRQAQRAEHERTSHDDGGGEKRIVDLIVKCVSEHVQEIVSTELDRRFGRPGEDRPPAPADGSSNGD